MARPVSIAVCQFVIKPVASFDAWAQQVVAQVTQSLPVVSKAAGAARATRALAQAVA